MNHRRWFGIFFIALSVFCATRAAAIAISCWVWVPIAFVAWSGVTLVMEDTEFPRRTKP